MISWRPCFVQQLEFGFSQKSTRNEQSGENRTEVYQRISSQMCGTYNGQYRRHVMKAHCSLRYGHFYKQCFHGEIHDLLPERLQFS